MASRRFATIRATASGERYWAGAEERTEDGLRCGSAEDDAEEESFCGSADDEEDADDEPSWGSADDDDDDDEDEQRSTQDYRSILADLDLHGDSDTPRPH